MNLLYWLSLVFIGESFASDLCYLVEIHIQLSYNWDDVAEKMLILTATSSNSMLVMLYITLYPP